MLQHYMNRLVNDLRYGYLKYLPADGTCFAVKLAVGLANALLLFLGRNRLLVKALGNPDTRTLKSCVLVRA